MANHEMITTTPTPTTHKQLSVRMFVQLLVSGCATWVWHLNKIFFRHLDTTLRVFFKLKGIWLYSLFLVGHKRKGILFRSLWKGNFQYNKIPFDLKRNWNKVLWVQEKQLRPWAYAVIPLRPSTCKGGQLTAQLTTHALHT